MPVRLFALYRTPPDEDAFLRHYRDVHAPLVRQTPNLQSLTVSKVMAAPLGVSDLYMVAEMTFADRAAFDAAMKSPQNRAAAEDLMGFAGDIVTLVVADIVDG